MTTTAKWVTVLVSAGIGSASYTVLKAPWHTVGAVVGGSAILLVSLAPRRRVILRFGALTWTVEELCRHLLITGDTGSGKTTSGFHQILVQLTRNVADWGGLVLGVKGDEHMFIKELADAHGRTEDVIHLQVRPVGASTNWVPPHRYNLLSDRGLPWMTHAKMVVDVAASVTEGKQSAFFRPMAQIALANAFELLDVLDLPVTIARAHYLLTSTPAMKRALEALGTQPSTPGRTRLREFFESTFTVAQAYEQREGIEGTLKTYLGFFLHPDIAAVFSSDEPNTFSMREVEEGRIISVTMPQRFATERRYIHTYLKQLFYYHALRRFDCPAHRGQENLLLLVADEFQDIATASEDGLSDHKTVDRVRAAKLAIIAGVQSELSLDPAIGREKRKVFTLNMRSRLIFRAADLEGATASADFLGKRTVWKVTRTSRPLETTAVTRREQEEHIFKPSKLMRLRDHVAVVVHPSKRWWKKRIVPCDGRGTKPAWFGR